MNEIWKNIKGYENRYMVSNLGRIKRLPNGKGINSRELIKSTNRLTKDGYVKITLPNGEKSLHRLVAEAFIPNPENKETVNHKDGNKLNNCADNLEWATRSEQLYHAYKLNLREPMHNNRKLADSDVNFIRSNFKKYDKNFSITALANKFHVSNTTIKNIIQNKYYK